LIAGEIELLAFQLRCGKIESIEYGVLPLKKRPTFRAVEKCLQNALAVIETNKSAPLRVDAPSLIAGKLSRKLKSADLRDVVLKKTITTEQARFRVKADGFKIGGEIYLKPDRLRAWVPRRTDRALLKENGVFRTRRNDAATVEQVVAGITGKPRYYVINDCALRRLSQKKPSRT
jgi:hypothetical protein